MTDKERTASLRRSFRQELQRDLGRPAARKVEPSFAICADVLEGTVERPGIGVQPFSYHMHMIGKKVVPGFGPVRP